MREQWHLDKRVPVALILTIALQFAGGVWVAASMNAKVNNNGDRLIALESRTELMREAATQQAIQLGRIEEQIVGLRADMGRMIRALEAGNRGQ